ncbi:hypothetical protein N9K77_01645 [bacterium]|nr:hypothetical protein [bacterium]
MKDIWLHESISREEKLIRASSSNFLELRFSFLLSPSSARSSSEY